MFKKIAFVALMSAFAGSALAEGQRYASSSPMTSGPEFLQSLQPLGASGGPACRFNDKLDMLNDVQRSDAACLAEAFARLAIASSKTGGGFTGYYLVKSELMLLNEAADLFEADGNMDANPRLISDFKNLKEALGYQDEAMQSWWIDLVGEKPKASVTSAVWEKTSIQGVCRRTGTSEYDLDC